MNIDFVGPGMQGPRVEGLQRLLKIEVTGTYDEPTTARIRGYQIMHGYPLNDGVLDRELLRLLPWDLVELVDLEGRAALA
jgi:hypothetical protein